MSERALDKSQDASATGQFDLTDLRASKDLHTKGAQAPANAADLSSASISATNIVRATHKPEVRRDPFHHSTSPSESRSAQTTTNKHTRSADGAAPGIFKNPTYRYSGGFISRVITFIANILKVLERLILRLLGARDLKAPTPQPQQAQKKTNSAALDQPSNDKKEPTGWVNTTSRSS